VRHYREAYGLFAANGILFNHESKRRGANFVSKKIVKGAVSIKCGRQATLRLGNLDAYRDWGHSRDYVKAMLLILEHGTPDDFVIATGVTHSIREMVEYVFARLDLDWQQYVKLDEKFLRPQELPRLRGDSTKARTVLGWAPTYTFKTLLDEMVEDELQRQSA
jgi:GDPmannose 4,6-dehydratase